MLRVIIVARRWGAGGTGDDCEGLTDAAGAADGADWAEGTKPLGGVAELGGGVLVCDDVEVRAAWERVWRLDGEDDLLSIIKHQGS